MNNIPDINRVFLRGTVAGKPATRISMTGKQFVQFKLETATGRGKKQKNKPVVKAWGKAADKLGKASEGDTVEIYEGIIRESVKTDKDGNPRGSSFYVEARFASVIKGSNGLGDINTCTLTGDVVEKGILFVAKDTAIPHITVFLSVNGPDMDDLGRFPVVLWGSKAEYLSTYLDKLGLPRTMSIPSGKIRTRPYIRKRDGKRDVAFEVVAHVFKVPHLGDFESVLVEKEEPATIEEGARI